MSEWLVAIPESVRSALAVAQAELAAHENEFPDAGLELVRGALKEAVAAYEARRPTALVVMKIKVAAALEAVPNPHPAALAEFMKALTRASSEIDCAAGDEPTNHATRLRGKPEVGRDAKTTGTFTGSQLARVSVASHASADQRTNIAKVEVVRWEAGEACLVLIYPPGPDMGKRISLSRREIVLGRAADCDIQVDDDSVSRRHARVYRNGEAWTVEDLQSTNGSYVNDVLVTKSVLRDADFVRIGAAIFKFLSGSGVEASYHEEIYRMTIMDALTGAHNKRYFLEFLEREIARCSRYHRPLSLLCSTLTTSRRSTTSTAT